MEDVVRHDDDDGEDVGVDTDDVADKSTVIEDEAVDTAVDKVVLLAALGVIGSGSRRMPPAEVDAPERHVHPAAQA
jgi:hypothetical protein